GVVRGDEVADAAASAAGEAAAEERGRHGGALGGARVEDEVADLAGLLGAGDGVAAGLGRGVLVVALEELDLAARRGAHGALLVDDDVLEDELAARDAVDDAQGDGALTAADADGLALDDQARVPGLAEDGVGGQQAGIAARVPRRAVEDPAPVD